MAQGGEQQSMAMLPILGMYGVVKMIFEDGGGGAAEVRSRHSRVKLMESCGRGPHPAPAPTHTTRM